MCHLIKAQLGFLAKDRSCSLFYYMVKICSLTDVYQWNMTVLYYRITRDGCIRSAPFNLVMYHSIKARLGFLANEQRCGLYYYMMNICSLPDVYQWKMTVSYYRITRDGFIGNVPFNLTACVMLLWMSHTRSVPAQLLSLVMVSGSSALTLSTCRWCLHHI